MLQLGVGTGIGESSQQSIDNWNPAKPHKGIGKPTKICIH